MTTQSQDMARLGPGEGREGWGAGRRALAVRYDPDGGRLEVLLEDGLELRLEARLLQGLAGASDEEIAECELQGGGTALHWPRLDADLWVEGLARGVYGSRAWMERLRAEGRLGPA